MNFLGHIADYAAAEVRWSDWEAVGVAWPDLRKLRRMPDEPLLLAGDTIATKAFHRGMQIHIEQDAKFHSSARFLAACKNATADLRERGVERGPARALSHVGYELLLDGLLFNDTTAHQQFSTVWNLATDGLNDELVTSVPAELAARYATGGGVATIIFHILSYRPRLTFPEEQIATAGHALSVMQEPSNHARELTAYR